MIDQKDGGPGKRENVWLTELENSPRSSCPQSSTLGCMFGFTDKQVEWV